MELSLASSSETVDPVCGMSVDPSAAKGSHPYNGTTYHFCSVHCLNKFRNQPEKYLAGQRDEMHSISSTRPEEKSSVRFICPMDPEVESDRPGSCPKCGMALEPSAPSADEQPDPEAADMSLRLWVGLGLGVPLFLMAMLDMLPSQPVLRWLGASDSLLIQWLLCTPVVLWCGWPFFKRAWVSGKQRSFNMFTLIALGVGAAYLYSAAIAFDFLTGLDFISGHGRMVEPYFESAAAIVVLVLIGQVLELRARQKTGHAIRSLLQLSPKTARLILPDGREQDVPIELVQPGDQLRVRPGERVAVDGIVREGSTHVDESMLTGEPLPASKTAGTTVHAGTLNGNGTIVVETQKTGNDTVLAQIVHLVGTAERDRMPVQALVDRVASWFVPVVLGISALTFVIWIIFGGPEHRVADALINAVAVLIIACPCALGLATPMAVVVGMGQGASMGVLFRNAETLERLGRIQTLVFDKTGTLTEGKPEVSNVEPVEGQSADDLLKVAASLERGSEHPLAAAIVRGAEAKGLSLETASDVLTSPGKGIRGIVEGQAVLIGTAAFLEENQVEGEASRRRLEDLREEGRMVVQVAIAGKYAGLIAVSDPIRPTTPDAIQALRAEGVKLVMLTGDSRTTAQAVARRIGIDEVMAEVLPAEKHERIRQLQAEGRLVAMAGDGINDAPALAQADVGIAMGTGADVAIESAGVTLIRPDLGTLVAARHLSRATMRTIRQNLVMAFFYNVLAIPVAAGILVPFGGPMIGPVWAAAAMSLSSLSVVGNSLRLRKMGLGSS